MPYSPHRAGLLNFVDYLGGGHWLDESLCQFPFSKLVFSIFHVPVSLDYSSRSATTGSIRVARIAGM